MYPCVIKTAINNRNEVVWEALYVEGKKVLENFSIDLDKALPIFAPGLKCEEIQIYESDYNLLDIDFPSQEDFSYLLDYRDIKVGDTIWLKDGSHIVSEIKKGYRPTGTYEYTEWINMKPYIQTIEYTGHEVTIFKVEDRTVSFIWEDYNYQQSYLYEHHQRRK